MARGQLRVLVLILALAGCDVKYSRADGPAKEADSIQRATAEDIAQSDSPFAGMASNALADGHLTEDEYHELMDAATSVGGQ